MWQLWTTKTIDGWVFGGDFESVKAAIRRIIELEEYPVSGIHFQIFVETDAGSDDEAFGHYAHTGRRARYAIRRRMKDDQH